MNEQEKMEHVFVYGTLKRGRHNHVVIQQGKFEGEAVFDGGLMFDTGGFPVCFEGPNKIWGELFYVNPTIMARLDGLEANGRMFERKQITVKRPDNSELSAWMYFGVPDYWTFSEGKIMRGSSRIRLMDNSNGIQVY